MRKALAIFVVMSVVPQGCKRRSMEELQSADNQPASLDTSEANLDKLKQERNNLIAQLQTEQVEGAKKIAELTLERDELNAQKSSVDLDIVRLQKELDESTTAELKEQIQKKLSLAIQERDLLVAKLQDNADTIKNLLKKMDSLSEEIKLANAKISDLNNKIEVLESELAVERSKVETVSVSTFPKPDAGTSAANNSNAPTPTPTPTTSPTTTPAASNAGVVSKITWQFFHKNADASLSCLEFGSTLSGASLLGLACVTPAPLRQQFKTETFGSQFLIVDQRTQMCARLDSAAAAPATARVLLGACKRGGDMDELWSFSSVNAETGEFQFKSAKTGNCLHFADDKKIVQLACGQASLIQSVP